MKLVVYVAEATGVVWFAVRNKKQRTPLCMSLLEAIKCWFKNDRYELDEEWLDYYERRKAD